MQTLKDKIVWITGASAGIGEAIAKACAREGSKLVLSARRNKELLRVAEETGLPKEDFMIIPMDMENYGDFTSLTDQVISRFGRVDYLFNNAGVSSRALVLETPITIDKKMMDINYFSHVALTKSSIATYD